MTKPDGLRPKNVLYAGIIWLLSALALGAYGTMTLFNTNLPGIAELVLLLNSIDTQYIYLAAFITIVIEGLYFIGSFFPGAGLVIILTILSQAGGLIVFLTTILLIFVGWSTAGAINIYLAKTYRKKIIKLEQIDDYHISDRVWTTWFPAFRASYEVAQVTEGANPFKVFISSLRVRFWGTLLVGVLAYTVPFFFDINTATDREGYISIIIVFLISLIVGVVKIKSYYSSNNPD